VNLLPIGAFERERRNGTRHRQSVSEPTSYVQLYIGHYAGEKT